MWGTDITYVPAEDCYAYLCAVLDWYGRHVLARELSNTLDASFCVRAVQRAAYMSFIHAHLLVMRLAVRTNKSPVSCYGDTGLSELGLCGLADDIKHKVGVR